MMGGNRILVQLTSDSVPQNSSRPIYVVKWCEESIFNRSINPTHRIGPVFSHYFHITQEELFSADRLRLLSIPARDILKWLPNDLL